MYRTPPRSDSEPELSSAKRHVSCRIKRKRDDEQTDYINIKDYMDEIKEMLSSNILQQEAKFNSIDKSIKDIILTNQLKEKKLSSLENTLKEIKNQNVDIFKSLEFISSKYEEMREKMEILEADRKASLTCIKALEDRIEGLERKARSCSIEMRNVTQNQPELKRDLQNIVRKVCTELNVTIEDREIRDIFRLKSKSKSSTPNPIIVEFANVNIKEEILTSMKKYRKNKKSLTTENLKIAGPPAIVYISENLTPKIKRLFYIARNFGHDNNYKYIWTSHGNVYIRKADSSPAIRINSEVDLDKLKTKN